MTNFWTRTLSGAIYVVLVVASLVVGLKLFIPLFAFITAVCLWEFLRHSLEEKDMILVPGIIAGTLLFLICAYGMIGAKSLLRYAPFLLALPYVLLMFGLFQPQKPHFRNVGILLLSFLYIVLPFILLCTIQLKHAAGSGLSPLMGVFILFWVNDTGAYLSGRLFGKTPLFPTVSPKKTREGLIGGMLLCLGAAWVLSLYALSFSLEIWLVSALIVSVFGSLGDLVESMWKRQLGIKDSGKIMPGHGGLLDRFDAFFIAIPILCIYLFFQGI